MRRRDGERRSPDLPAHLAARLQQPETDMPIIEDPDLKNALLDYAVGIVCAFVSHNAVPADALPSLISRTHEALRNLTLPQQPAEEPTAALVPAVPIKKSIADDHLVCLEDGKKFKSLKRHLMSHYNLTPAAYREKWGLEDSYPMVAPAYARARSDLAKEMGLGTQRKKAPAAATNRKPAKAAA